MNKNAENIRSRLQALELDILVPADLTVAQYEALALHRRDPADAAFAKVFPITVAYFKQAAYDEVYQWARRRRRVYSYNPRYNQDEHFFVRQWGKLYTHDFMKIRSAIFEAGAIGPPPLTICDVGRFKEARNGRLHRHLMTKFTVEPDTMAVSCLTRIGALRVESISHSKLENATPEIERLIQLSRSKEAVTGRPAREELRKRDILQSMPLGAISMMLEGRQGTLHSSCEDIPQRGVASAFFYAAAMVPINAPRL